MKMLFVLLVVFGGCAMQERESAPVYPFSMQEWNDTPQNIGQTFFLYGPRGGLTPVINQGHMIYTLPTLGR